VDDRGRILLLPERGGDDSSALQGARDVTIEKRGGQLGQRVLSNGAE